MIALEIGKIPRQPKGPKGLANYLGTKSGGHSVLSGIELQKNQKYHLKPMNEFLNNSRMNSLS